MLLPPFSQHPPTTTASSPTLSRSATTLVCHCHRCLAGFTSLLKPGDVALTAPVSARHCARPPRMPWFCSRWANRGTRNLRRIIISNNGVTDARKRRAGAN
uniref:Uncharacterized protein n=1 Tax=Zea mays TaxID=4577 RepID=A0A804Q9Q0_MAIZE